MPTTCRIARAALADLDDLVPLFGAYRAFYHRDPDPDAERDYLARRLQRDEAVVFIARLADAPAGFTLLYPTFASVGLAAAWILNDLYVVPEHRRAGVARALMLAAAEFARHAGAVRLELRTQHTNAPAQKLYESLGWKLDEQFRRYTLSLQRS